MARSFNGTSDFIAADGAGVANMNTSFSVAAWVNASGALTNKTWYGEGSSSSSSPFYQFQCNSGKMRIIIRRDGNTGTADQTINSARTLADGTWHHAVWAQTGSGSSLSWQVYIDGVADTASSGAPHTCTLNRVTIGGLRRTGGVENPIAATLGEIATWSRTLSAGEAKALASGLPASYLGPNHYWPLWGVDSPEPDIGNG